MRGALVAVLLLGSSASGVLLPPPLGSTPWITQTLETNGLFLDPDLAVGPDGTMAITYDQNGLIRFAERTLTGWAAETVAMSAAVNNALAYDATGTPWVAYQSKSVANTNKFYVATRTGWEWTAEQVDEGRLAGYNPKIAVSTSGIVHVLYEVCPVSACELRYAYRDGAGWHIEVLDPGHVLSWKSLAIDTLGRPHVAYCDSPEQLRYAVRGTQGGWTFQDPGPQACGGLSMTLDTLDRPHFAFSTSAEHLGYYLLDNGNWLYEDADPDAPTGWDTSIATDGDNRPHIAYFQVVNRANFNDPTRGHIQYATKSPAGWIRQTPDPEGWNGQGNKRIRVDGDGIPHIVYSYIEGQILSTSLFELRFAEPPLGKALFPIRAAERELP